jgi:CheY-like chemotaxis protein
MAKRILVVDDEPDILELLAEELEFEGFETAQASSGNDALEILKNERFDAIVSDFKMPNGNGKVVLDFIKSDEYPESPVFYFVSGQADMSFQDALKEGVNKFFYKPFDLDELLEALKKDLEVL